MSPITKFAASVPHTERIADMVSMAFREAVNGAPGPSYLEIPRDVLDAKIPIERARIPKPGAYRASTKSVGDPADIEKLADLWSMLNDRPRFSALRCGVAAVTKRQWSFVAHSIYRDT